MTGGYVHVGKGGLFTPGGRAGAIGRQVRLVFARQARDTRRFHLLARLLRLHSHPAQILVVLGRLRVRGGQSGELCSTLCVATCDYQRNHRGCDCGCDTGSH